MLQGTGPRPPESVQVGLRRGQVAGLWLRQPLPFSLSQIRGSAQPNAVQLPADPPRMGFGLNEIKLMGFLEGQGVATVSLATDSASACCKYARQSPWHGERMSHCAEHAWCRYLVPVLLSPLPRPLKSGQHCPMADCLHRALSRGPLAQIFHQFPRSPGFGSK